MVEIVLIVVAGLCLLSLAVLSLSVFIAYATQNAYDELEDRDADDN